MTRIELLREHQDTGRKVVPINTGKVQIGRCYTPPTTPKQAQCVEHYRSRDYGAGWWVAVCAIAAFAAVLIVRGS